MSGGTVCRISVSLEKETLEKLDRISAERSYDSRSRAVSEMVRSAWVKHRRDYGNEVMAGTLSLVYAPDKYGCYSQLSRLQRHYLNEVVSSLKVQLEEGLNLEVLLLQGPAVILKEISDRMLACRGVVQAELSLISALMPPLHARAAVKGIKHHE